ncbi:LytTR family DNA-binding domain-containing protein [Herbaspirillum sp. WKF16]|uniref:LytR/AlgR family response regulator transcription factor n=1 Tax=Herbaspirillum sp. WKF16 TaxID=3028312 RepID=UPI0023A93C2B|nr:LytTR family DNA-binding domain-containing protein [Herbaspirillum sp. WKF16]WDZ95126.1 LytTR family DNA-binding domain-containing protein [Herbaspirillum sp. WKF16]
MPQATALIAEDEPLLANALRQALQRAWPELAPPRLAANGNEALEQALAQPPDVLFLDIRMPGRSGLEVARELAEDWPGDHPFPLIVFVTAYDNYAVEAFERAAVDYLLKPVNDARLAASVQRLKALLAQRAADGRDPRLERALDQFRALAAQEQDPLPAARLDIIRAAVGNQVRLIPVDDVLYFEATDKYVNVVTAEGQALIRTSLRELIPQLDPRQFWQVHRGTVVQVRQVQAAVRDEAGKLSLLLRGRPEKLAVSRLFAHLFRQM